MSGERDGEPPVLAVARSHQPIVCPISAMAGCYPLYGLQVQSDGRRESTMDALLVKVPEAAALLGVSRAKLYELIASGALPAVKVDGCRRVRTEDLVSYVNALHPTS